MGTPAAPKLAPVQPAPPVEPPPAPAVDWRSVYQPEAKKQIMWEGFYLVFVLCFAVIVTAILLRDQAILQSHQIVERMLCCGLGGIAGSWIYSMKWYVKVVSKGIWRQDLLAWRVVTPFTGIFLAVSAYAVLEAGFFGVTFAANKDVDPRLYAYAIGFLVGLFADVVMGKLAEVAETLFGRAADKAKGAH